MKYQHSDITDNNQGLEESGGTRSSVRYTYTSEPRIWEETGSASSSMKDNSDSSVCNPEENYLTRGGKGPRAKGSVSGNIQSQRLC